MKFKFSQNRMLFWRVGNINSNRQTHTTGNIPPVKRGIWAFPWPYRDYFFVYQKYEKFLPKKYQTIEDFCGTISQEECNNLWEERVALIDKIMKREHPKTFWYGGEFYSHIGARGANWKLWDCPREWAVEANKQLIAYWRWAGKLQKYHYSFDHLEIFIPNY